MKQNLIDHRSVVRWWHEPVRVVLTATWVATLSLWVYIQGFFFYSGHGAFQNALDRASLILRTTVPLWLASFFPALAFGLAWYVFSQSLGRVRSSSPIDCGLDNLARAQLYMTLCIASSLVLVNWRLLPIVALASDGWDRVGLLMATFHWGVTGWWQGGSGLERMAIIGALGSGVIFLRAWGILRQWGKSPRGLYLLTASLLAVGLFIPWSGWLYEIPSLAPQAVFDLDQDDPIHRGLLLKDETHREAGKLALSRYFETHDDLGATATFHEIHHNWLTRWRTTFEDADSEQPYLLCELCQLPGVGVWTTSGLALLLGKDGTNLNQEPALVVEVPRRTTDCRVFDVLRPASFTRIPTRDLPTLVSGSDWIVLKIDWAVEMASVLEILTALRDHGVSRVDLAVIPFGYAPIPSTPARLVMGGEAVAATYHPRTRPQERNRVFVVKKYIPPEGSHDQRARCQEVEDWKYEDAWRRWCLERPASLPSNVSIAVEEDQRYGEFIGVLQGAVAGGAVQIDLVLEDSVE